MNVTVTQPTGDGYLTIFPSGTSQPLAANLNFTPAKTVPNLVVVKRASSEGCLRRPWVSPFSVVLRRVEER